MGADKRHDGVIAAIASGRIGLASALAFHFLWEVKPVLSLALIPAAEQAIVALNNGYDGLAIGLPGCYRIYAPKGRGSTLENQESCAVGGKRYAPAWAIAEALSLQKFLVDDSGEIRFEAAEVADAMKQAQAEDDITGDGEL